MENMFCYQCQETAFSSGCVIRGVCGKQPDTAKLQDLLIDILKGISVINSQLRQQGVPDRSASRFLVAALSTTLTNVNFDNPALEQCIAQALSIRNTLLGEAKKREITLHDYPEVNHQAASGHYLEEAEKVGILSEPDEDIRSLKQTVIYGLKGAAAYALHAWNLGMEDEDVYEAIETALAEVCRRDISQEELTNLVLTTGECGLRVMSLLDKAHTTTLGNPEASIVKTGVRKNPGILVSGHDLSDLEELLRQSEGTGIDIYTHGEMLPAHYYPALKRYGHLVGNYGNAWWKQAQEFESFNGPILMTSNCLVPPPLRTNYKDRLYTTNTVHYPGCLHIPQPEAGKPKDFRRIIEHAKHCAPPTELENGEIVGGFAHNQLSSMIDKIARAIHEGSIRRFVVMAGCDGRMPARSYYTEFARKLPSDTVILTAGCAKYRYNKLPLGEIDGIPRVLDAGQCNDSFSIAVLALRLKEVLGMEEINRLPIVYNIAWYEQKSVIVLLALLSLGIRNIHIGPTLPAFFSLNVLDTVRKTFGLGSISTPDEDLHAWLGIDSKNVGATKSKEIPVA